MTTTIEPPPLRVRYRNHRGETAVRRVVPLGVRFAATEWHPEPQWVIDAFDLDKRAERTFAARDVLDWDPPADDGEAVTEGNLRALGFVNGDTKRWTLQREVVYIALPYSSMSEPWCGLRGDHPAAEFTPIPVPKTVGDLRRLCAALGINLPGATA